jgi:hypothetical protein
MNRSPFPTKYTRSVVSAFLILFLGAGCLPVFRTAEPQVSVIQTVEVTREVTQEVTRIVEVPVTVTPTEMPAQTDTPVPTPTLAATLTNTPNPVPPDVSTLIHTVCLYGPDPTYLPRYEIQANTKQVAVGRNQDGSWLELTGADHANPCWVATELVKFVAGALIDAPVAEPVLSPYSSLYAPPTAVSTYRAGNEVTIFWQPIVMTEADYHGYLIEARVCQGGKLVFVPKSYMPTFDKNTAIMAIKVTDEPGCADPSSARIYTAENKLYSNFTQIPAWPPATGVAASATPTP